MSVGKPTPMAGWQRASVLATAEYLRDLVTRVPGDTTAQAVYQALLDVLEPARRTIRQQRELSEAARSSVRFREKREGAARRASDRRRVNLGPPAAVERRRTDRRSGRDRRNRA